MTYLELINKANNLLDANKITIGEWEKMITPLRRPILPDFIVEPATANLKFADCVEFEDVTAIRAKCTNCNQYAVTGYRLFGYTININYRYCPNCGAKLGRRADE